MNVFAEKLKTYRKSQGLSKKDVAVILGCSPSSISFYENGKRCPPLKKIKEICEKLKIESIVLRFSPPSDLPTSNKLALVQSPPPTESPPCVEVEVSQTVAKG